jgi:N-acyl-L-homoserine lactone synthetase
MVVSNPKAADGYRSVQQDLSTSGIVAAATAGVDNVITVPSAKHTIFVQKITVNIKTLGAQTITFQDDANTPVVALFIEASAAAGAIRSIDFGAKGFQLTEGKNLDISGTAAPAYSYAIEAYAKQTSATQATTTDRTF